MRRPCIVCAARCGTGGDVFASGQITRHASFVFQKRPSACMYVCLSSFLSNTHTESAAATHSSCICIFFVCSHTWCGTRVYAHGGNTRRPAHHCQTTMANQQQINHNSQSHIIWETAQDMRFEESPMSPRCVCHRRIYKSQ